MRNPSSHQGENERVKKVDNGRYDISYIRRLARKVMEVSRCGRAKQRQRDVQKSVVFFLLNRTIVVFSLFSSPSPLGIT